ncbi:transposase (plasmid) [Sinorhizobium medicae]|nr:transposase [Sinorhizobium medicae]WQO54359.1 transposase [Sinorhizobium medicae]
MTEAARAPCLALVLTLRALVDKVRELDLEIGRRARQDDVAKRLMSIPGIGPVIATALEALAPPAETFTRGRDFSAWMGLTPRQHSSGGKPRLGKTIEDGAARSSSIVNHWGISGCSLGIELRSVRWILVIAHEGKKPPMLITVALANRMGRIAWALMTNGGRYEEQRLAA